MNNIIVKNNEELIDFVDNEINKIIDYLNNNEITIDENSLNKFESIKELSLWLDTKENISKTISMIINSLIYNKTCVDEITLLDDIMSDRLNVALESLKYNAIPFSVNENIKEFLFKYLNESDDLSNLKKISNKIYYYVKCYKEMQLRFEGIGIIQVVIFKLSIKFILTFSLIKKLIYAPFRVILNIDKEKKEMIKEGLERYYNNTALEDTKFYKAINRSLIYKREELLDEKTFIEIQSIFNRFSEILKLHFKIN